MASRAKPNAPTNPASATHQQTIAAFQYVVPGSRLMKTTIIDNKIIPRLL
jgi:hypothetical protein